MSKIHPSNRGKIPVVHERLLANSDLACSDVFSPNPGPLELSKPVVPALYTAFDNTYKQSDSLWNPTFRHNRQVPRPTPQSRRALLSIHPNPGCVTRCTVCMYSSLAGEPGSFQLWIYDSEGGGLSATD